MATEETKLTAEAADDASSNAVTDNNQTETAAETSAAANTASDAPEQSADDAETTTKQSETGLTTGENAADETSVNTDATNGGTEAEAQNADSNDKTAQDSTADDAATETVSDSGEQSAPIADDSTADSASATAASVPTASFATEATAPEINALDEVHSEENAASASETPAAATENQEAADKTENTAEDAAQTAADEIVGGETATAQDSGGETADAGAAVAVDAEPATEAEPPKKENVVVKKLKLNPNAKMPAPATSPQMGDADTLQPGVTAQPAAEGEKPAALKTGGGSGRRKPVVVRRPAAQPQPEEENVDFGSILEQFEQEQKEAQDKYREGTVVEGKIVGISERGVIINFGYKSEGVANPLEFMKDGEMTVAVGDTTEIVVKRLDNQEGLAELSRAEALKARTWETLERAAQTGEPVTGRVIDKTKGGLTVDINGIEAFLPGSLIESRPPRSLDGYKGQDVEVRVIKFSRKRGNIVLSRKALLDEVNNSQKAETMANISEGFIVEGAIKSMTEYGAFVDLGGIDGLLHVTDMSWGKLDRPSDMFKVGEEVQVKVLKVDRDKERISLGFKQLIPNPWQSVEERYTIGSRHRGKVTSTTDYGAFVELEPGIEGLVHVSEMTWSKRAKHPNKIVNPNQEIDVQVLRIDQRDRRVSLGMRQIMSNPWETIRERYPVGTRVKGRVRNMTDFGAFVELEEGVDGLVHLSDITHSKKLKHPSEALKKNQEVEAVVTGINTEGRRMSLSMKDLQPSAWDAFVSSHKPGDVVTGKISRFANFGVFVELGDELEGLCHISELSEERIEKPEKVFEIGQELEFKILRIEPDVQKIGLSHRAVGRDDEPVVDTKTYSTEAKSGMASLGELANLRNLRGSTPTEGEGETDNQ